MSLADFLKGRHPAWNLVGRVYFNLAENRKDPDTPFAFLATYTSRLSAHGNPTLQAHRWQLHEGARFASAKD